MKNIILFFATIPFVFLSCSKEPITSVEGTYILGFNAASDGWKLVLDEGVGTLTHMADWEYDGSSISNFENCSSFTYTVDGDNIYFNNCVIALDYQDKNYNSGKKSHLVISLNRGSVKWGYTQGKKIHYSRISIEADVKENGVNKGNSTWHHPSAWLCDSHGKVYDL